MSGRRMVGAIAGGLVGGLALTALMIAGERKKREPSELVQLERASSSRLGVPPAAGLPSGSEQALVQGGHLLLSVAAAVAYAAATDEDADVVPSGVAFGLAFYAAMHWVTGPLLGVKRPEWEADAGTIGMHTLNHLAFGLATAGGAKLAGQVK